jgi:hypothetical protein
MKKKGRNNEGGEKNHRHDDSFSNGVLLPFLFLLYFNGGRQRF